MPLEGSGTACYCLLLHYHEWKMIENHCVFLYCCMLMKVQITHRLAWRGADICAQAEIEAGTIVGDRGRSLECQSGCTGSIGDTTSCCTDFSVIGDWSAGERTYIYSFDRTISYFEAL